MTYRYAALMLFNIARVCDVSGLLVADSSNVRGGSPSGGIRASELEPTNCVAWACAEAVTGERP